MRDTTTIPVKKTTKRDYDERRPCPLTHDAFVRVLLALWDIAADKRVDAMQVIFSTQGQA